MRVVVEMYGPLRKHLQPGTKKIEMDVPVEATVREVLQALGVEQGEPWTASLDGKLVDDDQKLAEGACLLAFPPIAGG